MTTEQIRTYYDIEREDDFSIEPYPEDSTLMNVRLNGRFSLAKRTVEDIGSAIQQLRKALRERDEKRGIY